LPPPDGSRDSRVEDPTNRYVVHLTGRALLPLALRLGVSANLVSLLGLTFGTGAAAAFFRWHDWRYATLGFVLGVAWLIADGLDGMIARATGTASPFGRFMDGICDHLVFVLIYVSLAASIGTPGGWWLASAAGAAHAVQSTLYEGERTRFHRRLKGDNWVETRAPSRNPLVWLYDGVAGSFDRLSAGLDRCLQAAPDHQAMTAAYVRLVTPALRVMVLLTNNIRLVVIYVACLAGDPRWYWLVELTLQSAILVIGIVWLRKVESRIVRDAAA